VYHDRIDYVFYSGNFTTGATQELYTTTVPQSAPPPGTGLCQDGADMQPRVYSDHEGLGTLLSIPST
jgi:hypothetical protein